MTIPKHLEEHAILGIRKGTYTGVQGATGIGVGLQGVTGIQGITGIRGNTGSIGATGLVGVTGIRGITGIRGTTGVMGVTGLHGVASTIRVTSSPYDILSTDEVVYIDTDGGAITVNLPAGVTGKYYKIVNCGSSGFNVTLVPNGAEQIYGNGAGVSIELTDGNILEINFQSTEGWW